MKRDSSSAIIRLVSTTLSEGALWSCTELQRILGGVKGVTMSSFSSIGIRPMPDVPYKGAEDRFLSFHPDQPVYWEDASGRLKGSTPEDAGVFDVRQAGSSVPEHLQGMLFQPKTTGDVWRSDDRKAAASAIVSSKPGQAADSAMLVKHLVESRMPTSLLHELKDSGVSAEALSATLDDARGRYRPRASAIEVSPEGLPHQNILLHELGHHVQSAPTVRKAMGKGNVPKDEYTNLHKIKDLPYIQQATVVATREGAAEGFAGRYSHSNRILRSTYQDRGFWQNDEDPMGVAFQTLDDTQKRVMESGEIPIPTNAEIEKVKRLSDGSDLVAGTLSSQFDHAQQLQLPGI